MIKTLLAQVKEYKTPSLLAPLCAALEVFFDMSIPFVISKL
ncbi:MAG: ABC transporter ATP-binding protein, partial [Streptococcus gallolyticus]